ncbi:MAG: hypothetical protein HYT80_04670 [Euryarchaeota archaeon]|nr:hypothetical protein [Euryarchaeota archaeon]
MRYALAATALMLVAAMPTVTAQEPVDQCSRQCDPHGTDVNGPGTKAAGNVNVIMYAHYEDILQPAPLNTVPPEPGHETDLRGRFIMPILVTKTGAGCQVGQCLDVRFDNNKFQWSFCPGTIEFTAKGWRTLCHARQLGAPLELGAASIPVYFYLSANTVPIDDGSAPRAGVMPNVGLYARLFQGAREKPLIVAEAAPPQAAGSTTLVVVPGRPSVYELRADMRVVRPTIDEETANDGRGFTVEVLPYQVHTTVAEFAQADWRVHTGPKFPPRMILPLVEPLSVEKQTVEREGPTLHYAVTALDALGSYDLDASTARLRVSGERELPESAIELVHVRRSTDHDGASRPVTFYYDVVPERPSGNLSFEFRVRNGQGTFELVATTTFEFARLEGANVLPSWGLLVVVGALACVAFLRPRVA